MEPTIDTDETIDKSHYFLKGNEGDEKNEERKAERREEGRKRGRATGWRGPH